SHGCRRRVDAALRLRIGHPLDAMDAGLELQMREDTLAGHGSDYFLVAADLALAGRHHLDAPALSRSIALVHSKEIAGKECSLVTARAGADLQYGVLVVRRILRQKQDLDLLVQGLDPLFH